MPERQSTMMQSRITEEKICTPSGTEGYDDLVKSALTYEVFGVDVHAASLKDILRSKLASNRPQDQQDVIVLREMLRRR